MVNDDLVDLIRHLNNKFMKRLVEWKNKHNERIQKDDRFHDKYVDYMRIVLGGGLTKEQCNKRLINKMYNYMKCDLKNILQYEFVF